MNERCDARYMNEVGTDRCNESGTDEDGFRGSKGVNGCLGVEVRRLDAGCGRGEMGNAHDFAFFHVKRRGRGRIAPSKMQRNNGEGRLEVNTSDGDMDWTGSVDDPFF